MIDFRAKVLKIKDKRNHKITNSYGLNDAWKWAKENKGIDNIVDEATYKKIIKAVNNKLANNLLNNKDIVLPYRMGILEIRKFNKSIKIVNNKAITNLGIDWKETLKLWESDEEARTNKTLVRFNVDTIFRVVYNKYNANYRNQLFYKFSVLRRIKVKLKEKINDNAIDSFIMNGYELY